MATSNINNELKEKSPTYFEFFLIQEANFVNSFGRNINLKRQVFSFMGII